MKKIAICFSTPNLEDRFSKEYGKKYPGAGWMKHMKNSITGKEAVELIQSGQLNPKDVYIVQEELNPDGVLLQEMGANPAVITCLESPIYASSFYDQQDEASKKFKHRLFFNGGTEYLCFPSFDTDDIRYPVPWEDRKLLCMVTANKHYSAQGIRYIDSPSWRMAMKTQLQDYRYEAMNHFSPRTDFNLYGRGWPHGNFECNDKIDTIRKYQFALCFENGSYPGYITEKIIDCFVSGVVPVYMGAPEVDGIIPKDIFIDARDFKSFEHMEQYLRIEAEDPHIGMMRIESARGWLETWRAVSHNNLFFAERIMEMCES